MDGIVGRRQRGAPRRRVAVLVALAALATAIGAGAAPLPVGAALPACTRTWTGGSGSWTDATRWSGGVVPTTGDHVCIGAGIGTVDLRATSVTVASLTLGAGAPTDAVRALTIVPDGAGETAALTATQGVVVESRGELVLGGASSVQSPGGTARLIVGDDAEIANRGTIRTVVGSGFHLITIYGRVTNTGLLQVDTDASIDDLVNDGSIGMDRADLTVGRFEGRAGHLTGSGWLRADELVQGAMQSGVGNDATWPVLQVYGGTIALTGPGRASIEARGDVDLTGSVHPLQHVSVVSQADLAATLRFEGRLVNAGGLTLRPVGGNPATLVGTTTGALGALANDGVVGVQQGDDTPARITADVVNRGHMVLDEGTTTVAGDVRNEGRLDLRFGRLDVARDVDLGPTGLVALDGDAEADVGGWIDADGDALVDGRLLVRTVAAAPVGTAWTVLSADTRTGTFDELRFSGAASYDPQYGPTQVNLVRRGPETPGERFVRASHQDFLDRQPTTAELEDLGALVDGGYPRASLVRALAGSPEYVSALVQRYYLDTLGRPGEAGGVAYWVGELRSGRMTVVQVAGSFYASQEYVDRSGGTLPSWIDDLYDVFFDRPPSDTDLDYWIARTLARGRTRVAVELFQSLESRFQRVDRLYLDLLGRVAEPDGKVYWAGRITREGDLALAVSLASSGEYLARAQQRYP